MAKFLLNGSEIDPLLAEDRRVRVTLIIATHAASASHAFLVAGGPLPLASLRSSTMAMISRTLVGFMCKRQGEPPPEREEEHDHERNLVRRSVLELDNPGRAHDAPQGRAEQAEEKGGPAHNGNTQLATVTFVRIILDPAQCNHA